jgi:hypothetical protein
VYVVSIGRMGMRVPGHRMMMRVTVRTVWHRLVSVVVMTVVVPMRMLVLGRAMLVLMAVRFSQMQHDAREHQAAGQAVAERTSCCIGACIAQPLTWVPGFLPVPPEQAAAAFQDNGLNECALVHSRKR